VTAFWVERESTDAASTNPCLALRKTPMSWDGDDIREIYRSPVEMGWGHRISFDHDIIGRAALEDALDGKSA
jgi:hypothetical protein